MGYPDHKYPITTEYGMTLTTPPLSETELTQKILEMAQTGIYRESIFEAFRPVAPKKRIGRAIAQAKQFGLYSVASLRDAELGTYYQVDPQQALTFHSALTVVQPLSADENWGQRVIDSAQTIRTMLTVVGGVSLGLFMLGCLCWIEGAAHTGGMLWLMAIVSASIWALQQTLARQVLK